MTGDAAVLAQTRVIQSACLACLFFVGAPAIPPLLRRLDSRSPLRAQQAGFGHADLVKHDRMEPTYDRLEGKCEAD